MKNAKSKWGHKRRKRVVRNTWPWNLLILLRPGPDLYWNDISTALNMLALDSFMPHISLIFALTQQTFTENWQYAKSSARLWDTQLVRYNLSQWWRQTCKHMHSGCPTVEVMAAAWRHRACALLKGSQSKGHIYHHSQLNTACHNFPARDNEVSLGRDTFSSLAHRDPIDWWQSWRQAHGGRREHHTALLWG